MSEVSLFHVTLEVWGAVILVMCALAAFAGRGIDTRRSKLMACMLIATAIFLSMDATAYAHHGDPTQLGFWMTRISNFFVFAGVPVIVMMAAAYFRMLLPPHGWLKHWFRVLAAINVADLLYIAASQFGTMLYYFDEANVYHRGPGFYVCSVASMVSMLLLIGAVIASHKELQPFDLLTMILYVALPVASNVVQTLNYGISLNSIALACSMLLLFLNYQVEKSHRLLQQEEQMLQDREKMMQMKLELQEKQYQLMMSQIQPHFIFNTLTTIEQLCRTDAALAGQATKFFARYLRGNLDTINNSKLIPFAEELNHIRNYIWLEKIRFDEDLAYEESIEADDFLLPALTVQPLVENAVKHGLKSTLSGTVTVRLESRIVDGVAEIVVRDNGGGMDTSKPLAGKHVGLTNVRERLEMMTGGTIEIQSTVNVGTEITLRIPVQPQKIEGEVSQ